MVILPVSVFFVWPKDFSGDDLSIGYYAVMHSFEVWCYSWARCLARVIVCQVSILLNYIPGLHIIYVLLFYAPSGVNNSTG